MHKRLAVLCVAALAALLLLPGPAAARIANPVRVIDLTGLKLERPKGSVEKPTVITDDKELAKAFEDKEWQDKIKKQVNFDNQQLVYFAWSGSGGDKLAPDLKTADKKTTAEFALTRGLTRDFRQHIHLYVVPKDAEVKVVAAGK